jgi:hypothetical protein
VTTRPSVIPCSVFGGRSPKTGRRVGSRHRWGGDGERKGWGIGQCLFCFSTAEQVRKKGASASNQRGKSAAPLISADGFQRR